MTEMQTRYIDMPRWDGGNLVFDAHARADNTVMLTQSQFAALEAFRDAAWRIIAQARTVKLPNNRTHAALMAEGQAYGLRSACTAIYQLAIELVAPGSVARAGGNEPGGRRERQRIVRGLVEFGFPDTGYWGSDMPSVSDHERDLMRRLGSHQYEPAPLTDMLKE